MPSVDEALGTGLPMHGLLDAALDALSLMDEVDFVKYVRFVLPFDGSVFWIKAGQLAQSSVFAAMGVGNAPLAGSLQIKPPLPPYSYDVTEGPALLTIKGSFHQDALLTQEETTNIGQNSVVFTAQEEVKALEAVTPNVLYLGTYNGVRFSFGRRDMFYQPAELFHYRGQAVNAITSAQIIDDILLLDQMDIIVSNSLPLWLMMNLAVPLYPYIPSSFLPLFPSYLVPQNQPLPYGVVHVVPEETEAIQAVALRDNLNNHFQLCKDKVEVTIYGFRNFNAIDFVDYVLNQSLATNNFGVMNWPVVQDEKVTATELGVIQQKKKITFEISYYQQRIRNIPRQLILSCLVNFNVANTPGGPVSLQFNYEITPTLQLTDDQGNPIGAGSAGTIST